MLKTRIKTNHETVFTMFYTDLYFKTFKLSHFLYNLVLAHPDTSVDRIKEQQRQIERYKVRNIKKTNTARRM